MLHEALSRYISNTITLSQMDLGKKFHSHLHYQTPTNMHVLQVTFPDPKSKTKPHGSHIEPLKGVILEEDSLEVLVSIRPLRFLQVNAMQLSRVASTSNEGSEHEVRIARSYIAVSENKKRTGRLTSQDMHGMDLSLG